MYRRPISRGASAWRFMDALQWDHAVYFYTLYIIGNLINKETCQRSRFYNDDANDIFEIRIHAYRTLRSTIQLTENMLF